MPDFRVEQRDGRWFVESPYKEFGPYSTKDKAKAACETLNWWAARSERQSMSETLP
jgi:hypothetical protein